VLIVRLIASTAQTRMNALNVKKDFQFFMVFVFFEGEKEKKTEFKNLRFILVHIHIQTQKEQSSP